MILVFLMGMVTPALGSFFRHDPTYALIEFPINSITASASDISTFLNLPSLPADEPEIEHFDDDRLKIWASPNQQKLLNESSLLYYPGIDENEINFQETKRENYTDPTNGAPPDWTKYCGVDCWIARAKDLAGSCAYPVEIQTIGKSVKGREIVVLKIGSVIPKKGPVLFAGTIHGNEPVGGQVLQRFAYETCRSADATQAKIAESTTVWYYPFFNPDGYEAHQRENSNKKDLNRNFPILKTPKAEVETTTYINFASKIKPSYSTMYHGGLCASMYPYFNCYDKTIIPKCPPAGVPSNHPRYADFQTGENLYAGGMVKAGCKCGTKDCKMNAGDSGGAQGILADWAAARNNQVDLTIEVDKEKWPAGTRLPDYNKIHSPIMKDYALLSIA